MGSLREAHINARHDEEIRSSPLGKPKKLKIE
jgi:hypothetical protein